MDYTILKNELETDPETRGYSGMSDEEAADDLNTVYETTPIRSVPSQDVFEAIVPGEYDALSADEKDKINTMLAMGSVDPYGPNTRAVFQAIFGAVTTTRTNLLALREVGATRAVFLGLGTITPGDVYKALNGGY